MVSKQQSKQALRALYLDQTQRLGSIERKTESERICQAILAHPRWQSAHKLLLFSPIRSEPDIRTLFPQAHAQSKRLYLPKYNNHEGTYEARELTEELETLEKGHLGILEPSEKAAKLPFEEIDLVLVPGLAFSKTGQRLGRGGGFYDRMTQHMKAVKVGVAYSTQWSESPLPSEPHDVAVNFVVTASRGMIPTNDASLC